MKKKTIIVFAFLLLGLFLFGSLSVSADSGFDSSYDSGGSSSSYGGSSWSSGSSSSSSRYHGGSGGKTFVESVIENSTPEEAMGIFAIMIGAVIFSLIYY